MSALPPKANIEGVSEKTANVPCPLTLRGQICGYGKFAGLITKRVKDLDLAS